MEGEVEVNRVAIFKRERKRIYMKNEEFWFWAVVKTVAGTAIACWCGVPSIVRGLVLLMCIDTVLGLWLAWRTHNLLSRKAWAGVTRKMATVFVVIAAYIVELHLPIFQFQAFSGGLTFGGIVAGFYFIGEILSILENSRLLGVPVPDFLVARLKKVQMELEMDKDEDKNDNYPKE
jgi:toxin secretion/phage lysis holin